MFSLSIIFIILISLAGVGLGLILPLIAIIDILRSRFHGNDNILFLILVVLLPFIGSIIYFVVGPSRKIPSSF
ncbi:MAG: hypothetical protein RIS29_587 [Bacteroidota bacterium]|jgi:hypothetical protein